MPDTTMPDDAKASPDVFARWLAGTSLLGVLAVLGLCIQHLG